MRKGELYFNWIFVIIIGAVFLAFFTGFAIKYKDLQEKKTEIVILNNLDTALTNLQSSSFTTSTSIELPLNINVYCDINGYSIFINEKNNVDYLLASKSKLINKMYIWYQPYKIPFKVTNFYYLIDNSNVKINANQEFYDEIIKDIPDYFKNKVVRDARGVNIQGNINEGTINNIKYLGKEMLYAGIFSYNYQCFYDNLNKEINNVVSIYENKARILSRSGCNYGLILSKMNMLRDFNNVNYQVIQDIETLNRNLVSMNCPSLF